MGVIGAGGCSPDVEKAAWEVGGEIARHRGILICGGLGGVMAAAARGAKEAGGMTVGILPGPAIEEANPFIDIPIATNMGHARNAVIAQTARALISVSGGYGTLSETALALKMGKPVVALDPSFDVPGLIKARSAREAVRKALKQLGQDEATVFEV